MRFHKPRRQPQTPGKAKKLKSFLKDLTIATLATLIVEIVKKILGF